MVAEAGVRTAFGIPGVHNLGFWRESGDGLPRVVSVRHEQTAGYAADGLARASGGLGVALTTTGPGAANAVTAVGEAAASGSPVLVIASEISTAVRRAPGQVRGVLHESPDQAALFAPLVKAVLRPRTPEEAVRATAEAAALALRFPRGPVYLDVPTDVLNTPAPQARYVPPPVPEPAADDLRRLAALIDAADRVILWAGGGVLQSGAADLLAELATRLAAPVLTTFGGRGVLPPDHPCLVGLPPHEPEVAALLGAADLLVGIGTQFDGPNTCNWTIPRPSKLGVINADPADLATNYEPDVAVLGDAALALADLVQRVRPRDAPPPAELAATRRAVWDGLRRSDPDAVRFLAALGEATPTATVVVDMAVAGYWWGGYGTVRRPRALQYPIGWGTLGYALPAAVGAACHGPAVALCGDGGVAYALGELATVAQERLPLTVVVVDDGGYGMLRFDQDKAGDPHRGVDLLGPDWVMLGRAFGIQTDVVEGTDDPLGKVLTDAVGSGEPRMVVVRATLNPPRVTSPRWHGG